MLIKRHIYPLLTGFSPLTTSKIRLLVFIILAIRTFFIKKRLKYNYIDSSVFNLHLTIVLVIFNWFWNSVNLQLKRSQAWKLLTPSTWTSARVSTVKKINRTERSCLVICINYNDCRECKNTSPKRRICHGILPQAIICSIHLIYSVALKWMLRNRIINTWS